MALTLNEHFEGDKVTVDDIDQSKNRENAFQRVIYEKKGLGGRFEHFNVEFGELVGRRMFELKRGLPLEIKKIVDQVADLATQT